ncbi:hypothetical protein PROG_00052, partial [Prochlorococcus phage P-SSP10]
LKNRAAIWKVVNEANSEIQIKATENAAVELYYDHSKKLETYASGCYVYGKVALQGSEDGNAIIEMFADEGDDAADKYQLASITNGNWEVQNYSSGSAWETNIRATGGGAVSLFYNDAKKIETAGGGINITGDVYHNTDNGSAYFGAGNDLRIYHDGGNSFLANTGGNLYIRNNTAGTPVFYLQVGDSNEDALKATFNGAVELFYNNVRKLYTDNGGVVVQGNLYLSDADDRKAIFGAGQDLQIWHDGSHSHIQHENTGNLYVLCKSGQINFETASETMTQMIPNGKVNLYYDNVKKFETDSYGAKVIGNLVVGTDAGELLFTNPDGHSPKFKENGGALEVWTNNAKRWTVESNGNNVYEDDVKIFFGSGNDLRLWHDGSSSFIKNYTGDFIIENTGTGNVQINPDSTGTGILLTKDAGVDLYYDGAKKFETTSNGATFTGTSLVTFAGDDNRYIDFEGNGNNRSVTFRSRDGGANDSFAQFTANGSVYLYYDNNLKLSTVSGGVRIDNGNLLLDRDNAYIKLGASDDLQIYHDGSNSYIKQVSGATGDLLIFADGHDIELIPKSGEPGLNVKPDGAVELYYDGIKKCETVSDGLLLQGVEGGNAAITMESDEGDDHDDKWQIQAASDHTFHLKHKAGNSWKTAWYTWTDSNIGYPVFRASKGGIRFDDGLDNVNSDQWNAYGGDGHAHRTAGQAYITADDHMRFRKNGNAENKRFDLRTDTGNGQAQNDWQDDQFDFAEFFEWSDGNPNGEDRIGHTVAVDGLTGKIKIAAEGDAVIGVVSGTAAFTANCAAMGWHGKYIRDEWGRYRFDLVKDEDGNQLYSDLNKKHEKITLVENPDWDQTKEYYSRDERKEWDKIGIIGQCYVRKAAVIPSSWIKLKEIDSTKDFYLIK